MKILDWYILRKFLGTFFFALLIMALIACVIDYSEKVDDFVKHQAPVLAILNYFKNFIPFILALLYPLFIFIATIFFTSKLAYKSEIVAMLAGGISFPRFLRPYLIGSVALGILSFFCNNWIVPNANRQRLIFEDLYVHENVIHSDENVHLRLSPTLYVFMQNYDYTSNIGYRFSAERIEGTLLKERVIADRASYDSVKKIWNLYNATVRTNEGLKETLETSIKISRKFPFVPKDLIDDEEEVLVMNAAKLDKFIARQKLRGVESLNLLYVEKYRRTSEPFAGIILTIIGACIASRRIRGGSGFHLAIGLIVSAVYILLMKFSTTFSTKSGLSPFIAVWIPNIIFGCIAWVLYRKQTR